MILPDYLAQKFPRFDRAGWLEAIARGEIRVNSAESSADLRLREHDCVAYYPPEEKEPEAGFGTWPEAEHPSGSVRKILGALLLGFGVLIWLLLTLMAGMGGLLTGLIIAAVAVQMIADGIHQFIRHL